MKALSLIQPWATLIAIGAKRIETRSWATRYRGEIAIHASKRFTMDEREICDEEPFLSALTRGGYKRTWREEHHVQIPLWDALPLGAIVAVARLAAIFRTDDVALLPGQLRLANDNPDYGYFPTAPHESDFGNYQPGRFAWLLDDVKALAEPIPCKGALNLWELPPDVEARIREALR
ncbi:MAG: ASCH domain-containing protein [Patescibacteria group bacterium]|nr:ASCH domain-containing protein [Patescibacteria group bacterium]